MVVKGLAGIVASGIFFTIAKMRCAFIAKKFLALAFSAAIVFLLFHSIYGTAS
jgi:hypothetical protein